MLQRESYPCLMWWPRDRCLIPIHSMKIYKGNCKFLEVQYHKPKGKQEKDEEEVKSLEQ